MPSGRRRPARGHRRKRPEDAVPRSELALAADRVVERCEDLAVRQDGLGAGSLADDLLDLLDGEDFLLDQSLGELLQLLSVLLEEAEGALVGLAEDAGDLLVD